MISLIIAEGALEILDFLSKREVGHFKELRKLKNMRTGTFFSTTTISSRLKELLEYNAIEKTISISSGRNVVAYKISSAGRRALELADRFDKELGEVLKK